MQGKLIHFLLLLFLFALFSACSTTKSVPEGEYLYLGGKVELGEDEELATKRMLSDVNEVITPTPNSRIAGLPLRLYLYQFFDNGKEKGLFPWARDLLGQPPVLFREDFPDKVERVIANRLFNNGYFDARVDSEIVLDGKKAEVIYHLDISEPYRVDGISHRIDHPLIKPVLDSLPPSPILKSGKVYSLADIQAETERISEYLKQKGFYFFNESYLKFQVDSTDENRSVNLRMLLREDAPPEDLQKMRIGAIDVYPELRGEAVSVYEEEEAEGVKFFYGFTPHRFRANPLADNILFRPGDFYNLDYHFNTLKRLVNLNTFSFVNVQYDRQDGLSDSLNMVVLLSPRPVQNIQGAISLAYKNSQYIGPELELTYSNRNLFRGSENLQLRVFTNLNFPTGSNEGSFFEKSGAELTLTFPGLRLPLYDKGKYRQLSLANTKLELAFQRERLTLPLRSPFRTFQQLDVDIEEIYPEINKALGRDSSYAPFVGLSTLELTFGYQWKRKPAVFHEFDPLGLGLQSGLFEGRELKRFITLFLLTSDIIQAIIDNKLSAEQLENIVEILGDISEGQLDAAIEDVFGGTVASLLQLEDMLYWNPAYTFTFDSRNVKMKRHNYFYQGRPTFTGNIVIPDRNFQFFNTKNLQSFYLQLQNDFRYFYIFPKKKHTLATRLVVDVSYPLGAELFLPFLNLFSVAGPNSVRAYSLRELGPGATQLENRNGNALSLFAGRGDIHLESSIEYRHKLTSMFELAAFADAGNVWVLRSSNEDANFRFNNFIRELGFGIGLGLRLNINPLVLRLDLAVPLTKPWLPEGRRWVGNQIDFLYGGWRKENLQFNLSFGYPF